MSQPETDQELLATTWQLYAEEFADRIAEVVTPDEHVDTEDHVEWGAQVFMFGYALGSIAGAHAADAEVFDATMDGDRLTAVVDTVIGLAEADDVPVSSDTVKEDFRGGRS